jgi:hypothetical protein
LFVRYSTYWLLVGSPLVASLARAQYLISNQSNLERRTTSIGGESGGNKSIMIRLGLGLAR